MNTKQVGNNDRHDEALNKFIGCAVCEMEGKSEDGAGNLSRISYSIVRLKT